MTVYESAETAVGGGILTWSKGMAIWRKDVWELIWEEGIKRCSAQQEWHMQMPCG